MKQLNISLTTPNSLSKAIEYLETYRDEINQKTQKAIEMLLDIGIECGQANSGKFKDFIVFRKEVEQTPDGYSGLLIAFDGQTIISEWMYGGSMKRAEVSPLLMAEFGSGQYAKVKFPSMVGLVGRGTFPEQKHAFQDSWWWVDQNPENGIDYGHGFYLHQSSGFEPTHPMHNAEVAMINDISKVLKEVFING